MGWCRFFCPFLEGKTLCRSDFPPLKGRLDGDDTMTEIYLDNSATTKVDPQVAACALQLMEEEYGNPSSLHRKGFAAQLRLDKAREQLAAVLGVTGGEILFTGSGSEGNNLAIQGTALVQKRKKGSMVVNAAEHSSVLETMKALEGDGWEIRRIAPLADGRPDTEALAAAVDGTTRLVTVGAVNSETGAMAEIAALSEECKLRNPQALLHVDGVQAFARMPLRPKAMGIDLLTFSGHKINAPKGVGGLYVRKGVRLLPVLYGGGQEKGLRPGTENVPSCCAMALAAQLLWKEQETQWKKWVALRQAFLEEIEKIPGVCINSPLSGAPYIVNFSVVGVRSETMIHFLEEKGIYLSSGSACSRGAKSHVLAAMGLDDRRIDSALRVSMGKFTTGEELAAAARAIGEGAATLARRR